VEVKENEFKVTENLPTFIFINEKSKVIVKRLGEVINIRA
jgi:hypothetical protein